MKVYNLACPLNHHFEGWFRSEIDFVDQQQKSFLSCPICESANIIRMPSAPYLGTKKSVETSADNVVDTPDLSSTTDAMHLTPEQKKEFQVKMQATMLTVVREIMSKTEDVGESFTEEARKIHYKESPQRSIRGVATQDQAADLLDEGIEVFSLPVPPVLKNTIQ